MAAQELQRKLEILASPLPPIAPGEVLTSDQWKVLLAIGDTVISSIQATPASNNSIIKSPAEYTSLVNDIQQALPPGEGREAVHEYLAENASAIPAMKDLIHRTIGEYLRPADRDGIKLILSALK
jgi:hypothetical protein